MGNQSIFARAMTAWRRRASVWFVLVAGLYLVAVPTYYTVFPSQARRDPSWSRVIVFGAWVVLGLFVLWRAWGQDELIARAMFDRRAVQRQVRTSATEDILDALAKPGAFPLPEGYELTVYLFDSKTGFLEPYFPHLHLPAGQEDPRRFKPGRGATGRAWEEGYLFHVEGESVATDEYHLTEEQREFFKEFRSVAATPIRDDQDAAIGVLTALSRVDDGFFESSNDGQRLLRNIADTFGVVLTSVPDAADLVVQRS